MARATSRLIYSTLKTVGYSTIANLLPWYSQGTSLKAQATTVMKCLKKMHDANHVGVISQGTYFHPSLWFRNIYYITAGRKPHDLRPHHWPHNFALLDVKVAFAVLFGNKGYEVQVYDMPILDPEDGKKAIEPDAIIRLSKGDEQRDFIIELDRKCSENLIKEKIENIKRLYSGNTLKVLRPVKRGTKTPMEEFEFNPLSQKTKALFIVASRYDDKRLDLKDIPEVFQRPLQLSESRISHESEVIKSLLKKKPSAPSCFLFAPCYRYQEFDKDVWFSADGNRRKLL